MIVILLRGLNEARHRSSQFASGVGDTAVEAEVEAVGL
jgi:hypothetical protein